MIYLIASHSLVCYLIVQYTFVGHTIGRDAFIDYDIILPLSALFDDPEDIVRKNTHLAFEMVSHTGIGTQ